MCDGREKRHWSRRTSIDAVIFGLSLSVAVEATSVRAADESFVDGLAAYDAGDITETLRIWRRLAEVGDAQAQVGLAGLHLAGSGVRRDPVEAARLYRLAAEQGDSNGQLNIGRLYLEGVGVDADPVEAYVWLTLAARQGRRWAEEKRLEIEPGLTSEQRARAHDVIDAFANR